MTGQVRLAMVGVVAGLGLQGCGDGGGGVAQVRVVQLSAGLGAVDLLVDGAAAQTGVPEMSVGDYVTVRAGQNHRVVAHAEGGGVDLATTATLEAGKRYDVAVFGARASRAVQVIGWSPEGSFRVVDLATDYAAVDVALLQGGTVVAKASLRPRYTLVYPTVDSRVIAELTPVSSNGPLAPVEVGPDLGGKEAFVVELADGTVEVRVADQ